MGMNENKWRHVGKNCIKGKNGNKKKKIGMNGNKDISEASHRHLVTVNMLHQKRFHPNVTVQISDRLRFNDALEKSPLRY